MGIATLIALITHLFEAKKVKMNAKPPALRSRVRRAASILAQRVGQRY